MNNNEASHVEQAPQIIIELNSGKVQLPLSTFNDILERKVTNYILKRRTESKGIIDFNLKKLAKHVQSLKSKYENLLREAKSLQNIIHRLKIDLEKDKFAQPQRCTKSASTCVWSIKRNLMANNCKNSNTEFEVFTLSDSEEDPIENVSTSKIKINDNDHVLKINTKASQTFSSGECSSSTIHKTESGLKSKANNCKNSNTEFEVFTLSDSEEDPIENVSTSKIKINDNDHALKINTEASQTFSSGECSSSTVHKTEPGLKSKFVDNMVPFIAKNKEMANNYKNSNTEFEVFTLSDSEEDSIENVSTSKIKINDNDHALKINTKVSQTFSSRECSSSTIHKTEPELKSKFVDNMVPFIARNKEINEKKKRLNECEVINNKKSNTNKLLNYNSVKELGVPEKINHNFPLKPSNLKYPPPYPYVPPHNGRPSWEKVPPRPIMKIKTSGNKITITWDLKLTSQTAKIKKYELFVCQETDAPPDISMWKKNGNIVADLLPMMCELDVFDLGHTYHFALRAVDVHNRCAPFAVEEIKI